MRLARFCQNNDLRQGYPELACFYEPPQRAQTGVIRLDEDPSESMPENAPTPIEFLCGHPRRMGRSLSFDRQMSCD